MIKSIKILGTGCAKCKSMLGIVEQVVNETGIEAEIEKVEDITEILKFDVMNTPALVIDGTIVLSGRVPTKEELTKLLQAPGLNTDSPNKRSFCS